MIIAHFLSNHWSDIVFCLITFFLLTARWIPARYAGLEEEFINVQTGQVQKQRASSLLEALMNALVFTLNRALLVVITFRGATTIIVFVVVGVELIYRHTISTNAVILAIVGILALHFESLIEQADEISLWRFLSWKRRK